MNTVYVKTSLGGFFFDATISESHDFENTITENPVQTGANANDHVFRQPVKITLQLFQSDCLASIVKGQFSTGATRCISAVQTLQALWYYGVAMTLTTGLNTYKSMVIKSCIINRDATTQTAIKATVTLQQLIVTEATTESVTAANGSTNKGTVYTVTPSAAILAYRETLLNKG